MPFIGNTTGNCQECCGFGNIYTYEIPVIDSDEDMLTDDVTFDIVQQVWLCIDCAENLVARPAKDNKYVN